jgi:hypothetical protein
MIQKRTKTFQNLCLACFAILVGIVAFLRKPIVLRGTETAVIEREICFHAFHHDRPLHLTINQLSQLFAAIHVEPIPGVMTEFRLVSGSSSLKLGNDLTKVSVAFAVTLAVTNASQAGTEPRDLILSFPNLNNITGFQDSRIESLEGGAMLNTESNQSVKIATIVCLKK